jgi:hypothetical protein
MQVRSYLFSRSNIIVFCPFPAMSCHMAERALVGQTDASPSRTYFLVLEPHLEGQNQPDGRNMNCSPRLDRSPLIRKS